MQKREEGYSAIDLIRIAKRDNNTKRTYLVVNPSQGKHMPVSPFKALNLFKALAKQVQKVMDKNETVLVIAFAETATAIGAGVANELENEVFYIQTTRENIKNAEYLYFSEIHSHAAEQKLVRTGLQEVLEHVDKVVFAEDEVTTGNTICNLIEELNKLSNGKEHKYVIASILNGMSEEAEQSFRKQSIDLVYLLKSQNEQYPAVVEGIACDGKRYGCAADHGIKEIQYYRIKKYCNPRKVTTNSHYKTMCENFVRTAADMLQVRTDGDILVLGTEEFMYPSLLLAQYIEKSIKTGHVSFHATTRSPVLTSNDPEYPMHVRYELKSLYDGERITFLYNLKKYDQVIIVTDAETEKNKGLETLFHAVWLAGNQDVSVLEWRD